MDLSTLLKTMDPGSLVPGEVAELFVDAAMQAPAHCLDVTGVVRSRFGKPHRILIEGVVGDCRYLFDESEAPKVTHLLCVASERTAQPHLIGLALALTVEISNARAVALRMQGTGR